MSVSVPDPVPAESVRDDLGSAGSAPADLGSHDSVLADLGSHDSVPAATVPGGSAPGESVAAESAAGESAPAEPAPGQRRHRRNPLIYFWVYSLARIALFLALWGLLWLVGLGGLIGAAVALALSVPLSYVLLARPRMAMTGAMMQRLNVRQERTAVLDEELSGGDDGDEHPVT